MSWTCLQCGLPDLYDGDGDGYGSCACLPCEDCGAPPLTCDCRFDNGDFPDRPDGVDDMPVRVVTVRAGVLEEPTYEEIAAVKRVEDQ